MTRTKAELKLKTLFGLDRFYDEQWLAIDKILRGERILMIERTGFGKSLCYQFPAVCFDGLTVIFSPLIALMRDQVKALNAKHIAARYINSEQTNEENTQIIQDAVDGKLKILYIAPERQENQEWIEATRKMKLSMVVMDEAHTISVWGHDFRPAFRRIINLVQLLPQHLPVLAVTATATRRVQQDIESQIGGKLTTIRGDLTRDNFYLYVIKTQSEEEKMRWMAEYVPKFAGTGLVYTGTRVNTEIYARWLRFVGIDAIDYNAGLDADSRKTIEEDLRHNRRKCIISTNALGMGIDKPDIRFIIHTQIPASPIHYYQEIGRAGRDGQPTAIVLLYNAKKDNDGIEEDYKLPRAFIDNARPSPTKYQKVIDLLKQEPLSEREIIKKTNLKQTQIRVIKADLMDQNIIKEAVYSRRKVYEYQFDAQELDTDKFEMLRKAKLKDLQAMVDYIYTEKPRMQYLCEFLDNTATTVYKNCDNTNRKKQTVSVNAYLQEKLVEFSENYFPVLEVESKLCPVRNGVAASYYGISNVGATLHRCKYEDGGEFPDYLLHLTLRAFRHTFGNESFDLILYVPPTCAGDLVKNFATKIAATLKIPISHNLIKVRTTQEQKFFQNAYLKKDNITDAFTYRELQELMNKKILLIDDIFDSGTTVKEIGKMLIKSGAVMVVPLVIAKTVGGDI